MVDKSFPRREILHLSAHLPESPSAWALFSLGPYFLIVFYSQWTYIGDGLASFRPMDMDPLGPSGRARGASFLSSSPIIKISKTFNNKLIRFIPKKKKKKFN